MVDWTDVLIALISALPAIIAAVGVILINGKIKTPSGTAIGKQIENVLHTALANHYRIRSIGEAVNAPATSEADTAPPSPPPPVS